MAMFPQFASTAASFTRASSLMLKVGTDAHLYDDPQDADIATLLDSKFDAEKAEGMKRLLALMSQGCDVSNFFPQVVKNVASLSLEVKKLVYLYLVHYAEKRPDEALLSINSFQKDLSDLNPLVRAWSLRAMSGIRVHTVAPLMLMAIYKCARDPSSYVRQCAANAIPKLYSLDEGNHDALKKLVGVLLNDNSVGVIGAAAAAFLAVFSDHLSMLVSRFQRLCEMLPDAEEWGQVVIIEILLRYVVARHGIETSSACHSGKLLTGYKGESNEGFLPPPTMDNRKDFRDHDHALPNYKDIDWFDSDNVAERKSWNTGDRNLWLAGNEGVSQDTVVPGDISLLLQCTSPLLWSHNCAVVLAAAGVHWLLAPKQETKRIVKPLLFLMRSSYESQYVVLSNIASFVHARPDLFEAYYEDFFVRSSDTRHIRALKLDILALIATESSIHDILEEFQAYVRDPDRLFAADTVKAIGKCAKKLPSGSVKCMKDLLVLARGSSGSMHEVIEAKTEDLTIAQERLKNKIPGGASGGWMTYDTTKKDREALVVTEAVLAIRTIVEQHFAESEKIFARLVCSLDGIQVPNARAVIIWMVGKYGCRSTYTLNMLPFILGYLAASFLKEDVETKLQIFNCVSKIALQSQEASNSPILKAASLVLTYLLDLGNCDANYDVRDRARMLQQLMAVHLKSDFPDGECAKTSSLCSDHIMPYKPISSMISKVPSGPQNSFKSEDLEHIPASLADQILLSAKAIPPLSSLIPETNFLPGSMSHMVRHIAPGYRALIKSFSLEEQQQSPAGGMELAQDFQEIQRDVSFSESEELDEESESVDSYSSNSNRTYSSDSIERKDNCNREDNDTIHFNVSQSESSAAASDEFRNIRVRRHGRSSRVRLEKGEMSKDSKVKSAESLGYGAGKNIRRQPDVGLLISLSDTEVQVMKQDATGPSEGIVFQQASNSGIQMRSVEDLESWLGPSKEKSLSSAISSSEMLSTPMGYASLSIGNIAAERKKKTLLDFTNGNGLEVKYFFSFKASIYSQSMACVRLFFHNRSTEVLSSITVKSFDSSEASSEFISATIEDINKTCAGKGIGKAVVIPLQEISNLGPGQVTEGNLHVDFCHSLSPVKLAIYCNEKRFLAKLTPEVGALLKPMALSAESFTSAELTLSGMLESTRRCFLGTCRLVSSAQTPTFNTDNQIASIAQCVASCVLQNANVYLVSITIPILPGSVGDHCSICLRFSGETLSGSMLCLITVFLEKNGNPENSESMPATLKVNCEDSIFGLNLLKQLDEALHAMD